MNDHLKYEGRAVEKTLLRFLDFLFVLGLVKSIHPQPFSIEYRPGKFYHPDVLVIFKFSWLKPWLIEGKGAYFTKDDLLKSKAKFLAAVGFARRHGYIFHFVTPAYLDLINDEILPFLKTHRGRDVPATVKRIILEVVGQFGPMPPHDVVQHCRENHIEDVMVEHVWRLAASGALFCDLRYKPSHTVVAVPVSIQVPSLGRQRFFRLPFCLIRGGND